MKNEDLGKTDTIKDIKIESNEEILNNTTKKWTKNCPDCGCEQIYSTKYVLKSSILNNSLCHKCNGKKQLIFHKDVKLIDGKWSKECVKCKKIIFYCSKNSASKHKNVKCGFCARFGMRHSQETIKKLSISKIGNKNPFFGKPGVMYGKHHTDETKYKLRLFTINDLKTKGIQLGKKNFNPKACKFIEEFGKKNGYNFQHAMNGGEVELYGYFVDGYDKERNIIFEYDEKKHYRADGNLNNRDIYRQNLIIKKYNPTMFIRYNEYENKLKDVISGKEIL
jgi:hypothetical protein